jgi:hypothetical protein
MRNVDHSERFDIRHAARRESPVGSPQAGIGPARPIIALWLNQDPQLLNEQSKRYALQQDDSIPNPTLLSADTCIRAGWRDFIESFSLTLYATRWIGCGYGAFKSTRSLRPPLQTINEPAHPSRSDFQ